MLSLRLSESFEHSCCPFWLIIYPYTSKIRFKDHAVRSDNVSSLPCCSISLDKNDPRDSIVTEAERRRHQTGAERQAGSGSLFTNRDHSEMEMESLSHGTDKSFFLHWLFRKICFKLGSRISRKNRLSIICDYLNWAKNANQMCLYFS